MPKQERIAKIHELAIQFTNSTDEQELKKVKSDCIEMLNELDFQSPTMGGLRTRLVDVFGNNLEKQIPKIVSGEISGLTDKEVNEALIVFENLVELSTD